MVTLVLEENDVDALCRAMETALDEGQLGPVDGVLVALKESGYDSAAYRSLVSALDSIARNNPNG